MRPQAGRKTFQFSYFQWGFCVCASVCSVLISTPEAPWPLAVSALLSHPTTLGMHFLEEQDPGPYPFRS